MNNLDLAFRLQRRHFALDVTATIPGTGITGLFGRSGCGKTTVLRCIAGLERAQGYCRLGEQAWQNDQQQLFLPTHRRPLGYVFQEASLFPHLSVQHNLYYGLKRIPQAQRHIEFDDVIELLGLAAYLNRDPVKLSGGERQRVAIGRALLTSPKLLLMDEPLSALDHDSKHEILPYLERLHDHLRIPVVYVTHDLNEIARLSDHMLLLDAGKLRAFATTEQLLTRLDLPFAQNTEASAIIDGVVRSHVHDYQLTRITLPSGGIISVAGCEQAPGTAVRVQIHARDVSIALDEPQTSSILNILPARIDAMQSLDHAQVLVKLITGTDPYSILLARITHYSWQRMALRIGQSVYAQVKAVALIN
jgi:molybdate transport system ATP-binding protein